MKKIIVGLFGLAMIFAAQSVFAATTWNGASGDCPNINIANYTTNTGYGSPCWNGTNISANPGDVINVKVYYHNTGTTTATNTRLKINTQTGSSTTHSFSAQIISDQGNLNTGTVTVSIPSSQSLTLLSTKWYPNQSRTESSLLSGQSSSAVTSNSGLLIGDIAPGWNTQGTINVAFKINSNSQSQVCTDTSATNYGGALPCTYPSQICRDPLADNYGGSLPCQYPNNNHNYCRIVSFDANDTSVNYGDSVRLEWDTQYCDHVSISGVESGLGADGTLRVYPNYTRDYVLNAYGNYGSDSETIRIYVDDNNDNCDYYGNCNNDCYYGNCNNYNSPTVRTYSANNVTNNSARLTGYVSGNGSRVNSWIEFPCGTYNYNYSSGNRYDQRYNETSSNLSTYVYNLNPGTVYNFCAVAERNGQIYRGNSVSFTTGGGYYPNPIPIPLPTPELNKNVVTTVATNIGKTEAQLNGYITSNFYYNSNVYFDYGTTVNLGSRTQSRNASGNSTFSQVVSGLSPNTIYFFQAVGTGPDGLISKGNIEVFKTLGATPTQKTVIIQQGKTVIGKESPVLLNISNKYQVIGQGDLVDYVVTYKNIGKTTLLHPMVQVVLPTNMTLINASRGTYSIDTHTLSAPIEDLRAGEEGVIYLQAKVDSVPLNNAQIVTTAIFVYTTTAGTQENAMNYVVNVPRFDGVGGTVLDDTSMLGGNAFFAGLQSIGLLGWLLIILIIMLIVLIARSYNGRNGTTVVHTNNH